MLILKIENFDRLADGGPISFQADRRGFDIGREQHLDWTLPDPTRRISGKHCEIRYRDGGYWLYDVSTNGTFVNKSERRVQSPYQLAAGDELQIGDYVISVALPGQPAAAHQRRTEAQGAEAQGADLWSSPTSAPPPISRRDLMPEQQRASRAGDFLSSAADLPPPPPAMAPMAPMSPVADLWAATGLHRHEAAAAPPPPPPPPVEWPAPPEAPRQAGYSMASVAREVPFAAARPQPATPRPAPEPERPAAPAPALPSLDQLRAQVEAEILRQFAAGAGIPEAVLSGRRAPELAQELGSAMRLIVGQLMRLLKVRAEAKGMVRAAERTMIQARDNNALKFTPTPEAALAIVFGPAASGYLDLRQTFERSFADVMAHEEATFAAMQQAVGDLLTDLSPESVERAAANVKLGFLGNAKAHNWETFLERWQAKAGTGDNGMLDSFLELFAEHYDQLSRRRRQ